MYEATAKFLVG